MPVRFKRRAARRRSPQSATLSAHFQTWVAQNLLRGVPPERIVQGLVEGGISRLLAARSVAELAAHPALDAALPELREARRFALVQRLLTLQSSLASHPRGIERRNTPSADELFDRYLATSTPFVMTDLVTGWPAFGKWSPEYMRERFGAARVSATLGREADPLYDAHTERHTHSLSMAEFVERVLAAGETNDFYMVAKNRNVAEPALTPLFDDVRFPDGWFEPDALLGSSALWFGPAGTVTPLHHDGSSILFCQIYGRKRLRLASPLETSLFEGAFQMYSAVDPERVDDPRVARVTFKDVELAAGEALFIPAGWWHHVRALDVSISLAVNHFARPNNYDDWYRPGSVP